MIRDWQNNEIPCTIDDVVLSGRDKRAFYESYASQVGEIVGFREEPFTGVDGINNWLELFNRIENEFKQQSFLKKAFDDSFAKFFNAFFVHPYGVRYHEGKFADVIDEPATADKDKDRKNKKIIGFARTINLPLLLHLSQQSHAEKYQKLEQYNEILSKRRPQISYQKGEGKEGETLQGTLRAGFGNNFWFNLLSNSDDCIFITHGLKKETEKETGKERVKEIVKFNEYWFASLLHAYHPRIYYLDFAVEEGKELKKEFPYPLSRAILLETDSEKHPLIVEGVLGSDLRWFRKIAGSSQVEDFIDSSLWNFSGRKNKKKGIFYGLRSTEQLEKSYHQFDEYVRKKYGRKLLPFGKEMKMAVPWPKEKVLAISNVGKEGEELFAGQQFSEVYAFAGEPKTKKEREQRIASFVSLEGKVQGIEVDKYLDYSAIRRRRQATYGMLGWLLASTALFSAMMHLSVKNTEEKNKREYFFEKMVGEECLASMRDFVSMEAKGSIEDFLLNHSCQLEPAKKKVIVSGKDIPGEYMLLTQRETEKKLSSLLKSNEVCTFGGLTRDKELYCIKFYFRDLQGDFEERTSSEAVETELIRVPYQDIQDVKMVQIVKPIPIGVYIPYLLKPSSEPGLQCVEITTKDKQRYLITLGYDFDVARALSSYLATWVFLRNEDWKLPPTGIVSPLKCSGNWDERDVYFRSKIQEIAPQFLEYKLHLDALNLEEKSLRTDDLVEINSFCSEDRYHYSILINKKTCLFTSEYKGQTYCEKYDKEPLIAIHTSNLREVKAIKSGIPGREGILYMKEREPPTYHRYFLYSYNDAQELEKLLKPFIKND